MAYTIYFAFEKGKRRNQKLTLKTREDCLSVIDNMVNIQITQAFV